MTTLDQATRIRSGEKLDETLLNDYLKKNISGFNSIAEIAQFPGGFSNLTYLIKTDNKEYVLRRPPFGASAKGGHDMVREYRVLSLLQNAGYNKVPTPLSIEPTGDLLGAPFYIMERLNGIILRVKDAQNASLSTETMRHMSKRLIDNLVDLHNLDIEQTELAQLGKPEGYVQRQVEGWIERYNKAQTDDVINMDIVADWLVKNYPRPQKPTFLHNDYKYDNVVWNENLTSVIGVLDWEMSTVGDPLMDLGAALAWWSEISDGQFSKTMNITWLEGNLTRRQVIDRYADKTRRDLSDMVFYYVFGLYKNAVIGQQIYARWKKGLTQDDRFSSLIYGVFELSKMGVKAIEKGKI
jgi:aminoglycoside phosphotransferase (APT) family kinase protein